MPDPPRLLVRANLPSPYRPFYFPSQVLESLHLSPDLSVWGDLGVICGMTVGFRLLAFFFVRRNYRCA